MLRVVFSSIKRDEIVIAASVRMGVGEDGCVSSFVSQRAVTVWTTRVEVEVGA